MAKKLKNVKKSHSSLRKGVSPPVGTLTAGTTPSSGGRSIEWVERGVFAAILIGALILHVIVLLHSGGLWRDEVNSINTIMLPTFSDFWDKLQFESFPILWYLILRGWVALGFGETDLALRTLGLITGLGIVGALWFAGRNLKMRFPFLSLVLFALCPTALWGDSLRAYGLGVILILLALGSLWRAMEDPVPRKMAVSLVIAVLSVQCLYHNSFLLLALGIGGAAVGLYRRRWTLVVFPLGIGAIAALSVLPYYTIVTKTRAWNFVIQMPISLLWIIGKLRHAVDPAGQSLAWFWLVLFLVAVFVFARSLRTPSRDRSGGQKDLALYLLVTMLVSLVSYLAFIKILSYETQDWYYLPLMAVIAVIVDKGADMVCERYAVGRWVRVVCVAGAAACIFMTSWDAAHVRKTNVDLLAAKLEAIAQKDDFIVVTAFFFGLPFDRYYGGAVEWVTLPDMDDHAVHRFDLFKKRMTQEAPIRPVIEEMLETLREGNRVWLVGALHFLRQGESPGDLPPAPHSSYGWDFRVYQNVWSRQAGFALQSHGQTLRRIRISTGGPVSEFENLPLFVVQGWRS